MKKFTTAERIKQVMQERNLKQVDILKMSEPYQEQLGIKLTKSHLSNYVNGRSNPHLNSLHLLAKTLNVSQGWLMGYDDVVQGDNKAFTGEKIKMQRESLGLTQDELAEKASVPLARLEAIEGAMGFWTIEELRRIARALEIQPESLYLQPQLMASRFKNHAALFELLKGLGFKIDDTIYNLEEPCWHTNVPLLYIQRGSDAFMLSMADMNTLTSKMERYFEFEFQELPKKRSVLIK